MQLLKMGRCIALYVKEKLNNYQKKLKILIKILDAL